MSDSVKRTIEIVMVVVLIGIGAVVLFQTGESRDKNGDLGFLVDPDTQNVLSGDHSARLDPADTVKLAPFLPTPMCVVEKMLELAEVDEDDIV